MLRQLIYDSVSLLEVNQNFKFVLNALFVIH